MTPQFCQTFWVPFFADGEVVPGDQNAEKPPGWVRLISGLHIKYVVLTAVGLYLLYHYWPLVLASLSMLLHIFK